MKGSAPGHACESTCHLYRVAMMQRMTVKKDLMTHSLVVLGMTSYARLVVPLSNYT